MSLLRALLLLAAPAAASSLGEVPEGEAGELTGALALLEAMAVVQGTRALGLESTLLHPDAVWA